MVAKEVSPNRAAVIAAGTPGPPISRKGYAHRSWASDAWLSRASLEYRAPRQNATQMDGADAAWFEDALFDADVRLCEGRSSACVCPNGSQQSTLYLPENYSREALAADARYSVAAAAKATLIRRSWTFARAVPMGCSLSFSLRQRSGRSFPGDDQLGRTFRLQGHTRRHAHQPNRYHRRTFTG